MSSEFKRARFEGELDKNLFFGNGWRDLNEIMDHTDDYYARTVNINDENISYEEKYNIAMAELNAIKNSKSFKLYRIISYGPKKVRGGYHCLKENGMNYTVHHFFEKLRGIK